MAKKATGFQLLKRSEIHPNPKQPRQFFEQDALQELADSIAQHGLMQPLCVRPDESGYEIIAGERRWRACGLAGIEEIACKVLDIADDEAAFILSVTENLCRRDMTAMEEAAAFARLAQAGRSNEEIAALFGKGSAFVVAWRISLLNLREDFQHLVAHGQIGLWLAQYLAKLSIDGQAEVMAKVVAGTFKSDDETSRYAAAVLAREQQGGGFFSLADGALDGASLAKRAETRTAAERAWSQIEGMSKALGIFQGTTPEDLAGALGADTEQYRVKVAALAQMVRKAEVLLKQASALAAAAETLAVAA